MADDKLDKVIKEWEAVLSRDPLDAPWDLIDETLELLKEKEPVYATWQQGKMCCGACGAKFPSRTMMRFCHRCGREIRLKAKDN